MTVYTAGTNARVLDERLDDETELRVDARVVVVLDEDLRPAAADPVVTEVQVTIEDLLNEDTWTLTVPRYLLGKVAAALAILDEDLPHAPTAGTFGEDEGDR